MPCHPRICLPGFAALFVGAVACAAIAAEPPPAVQKHFEKLLAAMEAKDRAAFVENATDAVRDGTTEAVMAAIADKVGKRLQQGHQATYLCQLKQLAHEVHLWKISFQDGGDDLVARMVLKDGKLAGFFFQ